MVSALIFGILIGLVLGVVIDRKFLVKRFK